jgi:PhoPQ-activated pathogenicity-related protein
MGRVKWIACVAVTLVVASQQAVNVSTQGAAAKRSNETALDRYVKAPDASYRYSVIETRPGEGQTTFLLELVSQTWLTAKEVDKTEWRHWLTIVKPDTVAHSTAFVFVTGGDSRRKPPARLDAGLTDIAVTTQSVVAELRMVPNQPLVFGGDGKERVEDDLIAYTWDKYLRTGDERWPARLPMTKSVVRAMDAITDFCGKPEQGTRKVDRFVVAGASKRGWTTWATAAVDRRVVAIAPIVIDVLNVEPSFLHHWQAYGFWAPAVKDYEQQGIMKWMQTPQNRALLRIEDPYEYRDRLTMPKYIVNSAGDQFFLPDSWRFYFDDLKGEKHLRYVPNTDHSLKGSDALQSVAAFYSSILTNTPRPDFTWKAGKDGRLRIETRTKPESVTLWTVTNPDKRDFRLETIGAGYQSSALEATSPGVYEAKLAKPEKGWTAGLIELRFPSGTKYPFVFTTGVAIVPEAMPFPAPAPNQPPPGVWTPK